MLRQSLKLGLASQREQRERDINFNLREESVQKRLEELEVGDLVEVPESIKTYAARYSTPCPEVALVSKLYTDEDNCKSMVASLLGPVGTHFRLFSGNWLPSNTPFEIVPNKIAEQLRGRILDTFYGHREMSRNGETNLLPAKCFCGTDPEIFVVDKQEEVIPAWTFLQSKKETTALSFNGSKYIYWDGFQSEFSQPNGNNCLELLNLDIWFCLKKILECARVKVSEAKLSLKNVVDIPMPLMLSAEKKHVELGCAPSFNVYGDRGKRVADPRELLKRFAGGHLHYGLSQVSKQGIDRIVRALDTILGVAGVSLAAEIDDPIRREYYGRAGEYRLPKHGLEYRVLSNFWLIHPAVAMLVNELFRVTIRLAQIGLHELTWKADEDEVRSVINNCDVEGARKMLVKNSKTLEALFYHTNFGGGAGSSILDASVESAMFTVLNGLEALRTLPQDIEKNWRLDMETDKWSLDSCLGRWYQYTSRHSKLFAPAV
jgi:hypothetical protein